MSLKSRLGAEVAFALNILTLLSLAMRILPNDQSNLHFPLSGCGFLLDELVDLLEESAFGIEGEFSDEEEDSSTMGPNGCEDASTSTPVSYRDLFRLVTEEEAELLDDPVSPLKTATDLSNDGLCPLGPVETVSAVMNLLRNFSLSDENARMMAGRPELVDLLVRVANLPLRRNGPTKKRWPIRVSAAESMALRKDVLVVLSNFGTEIRLSRHSPETVASLFDLLTFFLADSDQQDQLYFDLSSSPSPSSSRLAQSGHQRLSHYVDLGLAAFARITLTDSNRSVLAKTLATRDLFPLFESLVHLLPISETDFQVVTSEGGLVFTENLAMSIYSLAFFAPVELKLRLRVVPAFIRGLLRVVRRLMGASSDPAENPFMTLSDRCLATLQILSDVGGTTGRSQEDADAPWFGMGMNGDLEDSPKGCNPAEVDRATVKARLPPTNGANPGGPPVLSADTRSIFDMLASGSGTAMFIKLMGSGLVDLKRGAKE